MGCITLQHIRLPNTLESTFFLKKAFYYVISDKGNKIVLSVPQGDNYSWKVNVQFKSLEYLLFASSPMFYCCGG